MKKTVLLFLSVCLFLLSLGLTGCSSELNSEGFAIYLTARDIPPSQMEPLSRVAIADSPIISSDDIIWYYQNTHEIELTAAAYRRINELQVPTSGKTFVVCVDKEPIYWGAFWTPASSLSFSGIIINVIPFSTIEHPGNVIKLDLGYPTPSFYQGEDPRDNPVILQALEKAGKLN
jgi:hypothetical protein